MNTTPESRSVEVTATRSHDGMRKQKGLLLNVRGILDLGEIVVVPATDDTPAQTRARGARDIEWTHKPAQDGRPEMWRGKFAGVEIWCKELNPLEDLDGEQIVGDIEIKLNEVTGTDGGKSQYLYINVLPPTNNALPIGHVFVIQPQKEGTGRERRKVLPSDFDKDVDYATYRQGEPWQVIQVRTA